MSKVVSFFRGSDPDPVFSRRLDLGSGFFSRRSDPDPVFSRRLDLDPAPGKTHPDQKLCY